MNTEADVYNALKYHVEVDSYGTRRYYNDAGLLHREDGPAVEHLDDTKCWYHNGLRHRIDGPAVEYVHGACQYWIDGAWLNEAVYPDAVKRYLSEHNET